jgi:hypothetical protein
MLNQQRDQKLHWWVSGFGLKCLCWSKINIRYVPLLRHLIEPGRAITIFRDTHHDAFPFSIFLQEKSYLIDYCEDFQSGCMMLTSLNVSVRTPICS